MPQEDIDSEISNDTTTTDSTLTADPGNTEGSTESIPADDSSSVGGTSTEAPAQADPATDDGNPGNQVVETTETSGAPAVPWEKRFKDTQSAYTKSTQEKQELARQFQELQQQFQDMRQQYAGVKPEEVQEYRSSKALKPWDEGSPEHSTFLNLVSKAEFFDELAQGETDQAELQKLQQRMVRAIGEPGLKMLDSWKADVRQQERERRLNPKAFYQKLIREQAQPVVRETLQESNHRYQEGLRGQKDAEQWMANKEVATPENIAKMRKLLDSMPFDVAAAIVERDHYRSQVSNATKAKQSAEEKERLLQGNAAGAISRNPSSSKRLDVTKHLKEKGISGRAMLDELMALEQQGLLPPM